MEDGSNIAFFECPKDPGNMKDLESPDWIQHFAFEVENEQVLHEAKSRLEARGLKVVGPTNHDDIMLSIYFFDPSGHRLELTVRTCEQARAARFEVEAPKVLEVWNQTHDWSQRDKAFGSMTGYAHSTGH